MKEYTQTPQKPTEKIYPDDDDFLQAEIRAWQLEETEREAELAQIAFEREQEHQAIESVNNQLVMLNANARTSLVLRSAKKAHSTARLPYSTFAIESRLTRSSQNPIKTGRRA